MTNVPTLYSGSLGESLPVIRFAEALKIIHQIAEGDTVLKACQTSRTTVAAFRQTLAKEPDLKALADQAIDIGSDVLADMLLDENFLPHNPQKARMFCDNVKWLLERRKPERYGQKVQHTMENNATAALIAALDASIQRIPLPASDKPRGRYVEAEVVFVDKKEALPRTITPPSSLAEMKRLGLI